MQQSGLLVPPKVFSSVRPYSCKDSQLFKFELEEQSFGFSQKTINFDLEATYLNAELITPPPQPSGFYKEINTPRQKMIQNFIEEIPVTQKISILEIGGHNLENANFLRELKPNAEIICVDPAFDQSGTQDGVSIIKGFFPKDFEGKKFNMVVSFNTLEHVIDIGSFLAAISNSLIDGGILILSAPDSTRQILEGDWNLLTQQHLHYIESSSLLKNFFPNFGKLLSFENLNDEFFIAASKGVTTSQNIPTEDNHNKQRLNLFLTKLDNQLQNFENFLTETLVSKKKVIFHGATSGILNLIANSHNSALWANQIQIIDNDPLKQNKFFGFFENKIKGISSVTDDIDLVFITTSTFKPSIIKSWDTLNLSKKPEFFCI